MKKNVKLGILAVITLIVSCNKKNINSIEKRIDSTSSKVTLNDSIINMANTAIIKGDTLAYKAAYRYFSVNYYEKEFLYYSMIMADKYDYSQAYFDTYTILTNVNDENKINDCNFCQYYLLKSFEKNNHYAKDIVKEMYVDKELKIPTSKSILEK